LTAELTEQALALLRVGYLGGFLGTFAFFLLWEGGRPLVASPTRRTHVARNLGLFAVTLGIMYVLLRPWLPGESARLPGMPEGLLGPLGLSKIALFVIGFLFGDLVEYLFHRLCHAWKWLWLVHAVHHSDPELDVSSGLRFHPLEVVLGTALKIAVFAALGIPLWIEAARAVVVHPMNFLQHANIAYPAWVERRLRWLLVTPALHRLHHSPLEPETDANYGVVLSTWDRLLGTYRHPPSERPARYGLSKLVADSWQTVGGMLMTPVRARRLGTL
jgi:sterol desaturase/sphingolipid hydroxylase (fatty acid hydroxylase superfamily)